MRTYAARCSMNAEDIMTRDPVTANERATIGEAWRLLAEAPRSDTCRWSATATWSGS